MKITWLITLMLPGEELDPLEEPVPPEEEPLPLDEEPVPVEVVVDAGEVVPVRFKPAQPDNAAMNKTVATARAVSAETTLVATTPFPFFALEAAALGRVADLMSRLGKVQNTVIKSFSENLCRRACICPFPQKEKDRRDCPVGLRKRILINSPALLSCCQRTPGTRFHSH